MDYKIKIRSAFLLSFPYKRHNAFSVSTKVEWSSYDPGVGSRADLYLWLQCRGWQGLEWDHQTDFLLVDVGDHSHRGADHVHGVLPKQFELIVDELLPEATVGTDDRPAWLGPRVGIQQGHGVVLHEVGEAEGSWAAHPRGAMQQRAALLHRHAVDVVGDGVKEVTETRDGGVSHRHLHVLDVLV